MQLRNFIALLSITYISSVFAHPNLYLPDLNSSMSLKRYANLKDLSYSSSKECNGKNINDLPERYNLDGFSPLTKCHLLTDSAFYFEWAFNFIDIDQISSLMNDKKIFSFDKEGKKSIHLTVQTHPEMVSMMSLYKSFENEKTRDFHLKSLSNLGVSVQELDLLRAYLKEHPRKSIETKFQKEFDMFSRSYNDKLKQTSSGLVRHTKEDQWLYDSMYHISVRKDEAERVWALRMLSQLSTRTRMVLQKYFKELNWNITVFQVEGDNYIQRIKETIKLKGSGSLQGDSND